MKIKGNPIRGWIKDFHAAQSLLQNRSLLTELFILLFTVYEEIPENRYLSKNIRVSAHTNCIDLMNNIAKQ